MPSQANTELMDSILRHEVGVRRYTAYLSRQLLELMSEADFEFTSWLRSFLEKNQGKEIDVFGSQWQKIIKKLTDLRGESFTKVEEYLSPELDSFAKQELNIIYVLLGAAIPFDYKLKQTTDINIDEVLILGQVLSDWINEAKNTDVATLTKILQHGIATGQSVDAIISSIAGDAESNHTTGVLATSRRNIQGIMESSVTALTNLARDEAFTANSDIIQYELWVSTLDGRTSAICRANDGKIILLSGDEPPDGFELLEPQGLRPPAHYKCRSIIVAIFNSIGLLGDRPYVVDTRTPDKRRIDFKKIAEETGRDWKEVRNEWAAKNIGTVPATTTYSDFLKRQTNAFQASVLGKTKAELFRKGELTLTDFVDETGHEYSLKELAQQHSDAYRKAGLDPNNFK